MQEHMMHSTSDIHDHCRAFMKHPMKFELTEEVHKYKCCVAETLLIKNLSPALSKNEGLDISALIH